VRLRVAEIAYWLSSAKSEHAELRLLSARCRPAPKDAATPCWRSTGDAMTERFVVQVAPDRFDVIAGHKLNAGPLDLADANQLARRSSASAVSVAGQLVNGTKPP
jgi:sarcosine oxidase gamma subunit